MAKYGDPLMWVRLYKTVYKKHPKCLFGDQDWYLFCVSRSRSSVDSHRNRSISLEKLLISSQLTSKLAINYRAKSRRNTCFPLLRHFNENEKLN